MRLGHAGRLTMAELLCGSMNCNGACALPTREVPSEGTPEGTGSGHDVNGRRARFRCFFVGDDAQK